MKIFIVGGFGFVGSSLTSLLAREGHELTLLDRNPGKKRPLPSSVQRVEGDGTVAGPWLKSLVEHDAVINLAGETIFTRWTQKKKDSIYGSRILTTRNISDAILEQGGAVRLLINTSAVGYYGFHKDEPIDESGSVGDDFLARVCYDWEQEALRAESAGVRVALCRFGIVLGKSGGALEMMRPIFKLFLGSPLGRGKQYFSWIHESDLINSIRFVLEHTNITGAVNCCAPNPVTNAELTRKLAGALHRPVLLPGTPAFLLRLVLGEMGDVVIKGQRAVPEKLQNAGFSFSYPFLEEALVDLV